jgi:hypothetical protein
VLRTFVNRLLTVTLCTTLAACEWADVAGVVDQFDGAVPKPDTTSVAPRPTATSRILDVAPRFQQTPVWCWAASAEMVLSYYGLPNLNGAGNYQCGIVAAMFGPRSACWYDCTQCVTGGGSMSNIQALVAGYGRLANQLGVPSRVLTSSLVFGPLPASTLQAEIDAGRPIIAGISANGFVLPNISEHVAVIVGYDFANGRSNVIVNDPFPYDLPQFAGRTNPYLAAGGRKTGQATYVISLEALVSRLNWGNTIYRIRPE